jgi:hypothetical protein
MKRRNAFVIALLIGVVALVGLVAATRSARLGHAAGRPAVSSASIDARMRALDRADASLRRALAQKPAVGRAAPPQKVIYVRPAPHVATIHRHGGEHETEGSDHEGGGFDD